MTDDLVKRPRYRADGTTYWEVLATYGEGCQRPMPMEEALVSHVRRWPRDAAEEMLRLKARAEAAEAEVERLRKAIDDYLAGNYPRAPRNGKCEHGLYSWDACENCIDNYFMAALAAKEPPR